MPNARLLMAFLAAALFSQPVFSQNKPSFDCGFDTLRTVDEQARIDLFEKGLPQFLSKKKDAETAAPAPFTIPVVVHIIHDGGPENISDARILAAIENLNSAFAAANYFAQNGATVDTKIQFCLAKRSPDGSATNGITRDQSPLTNMVVETEDIFLKNINRWKPTDYVNIWVVKEITSLSIGAGVAGYAYFPSSHGGPNDGMVCEAAFFGKSPSDDGVLIHEMGHYLGLYHTFEGGCKNDNCAADGDRVCDTPPDQAKQTACPFNSCSTDVAAGSPFLTDVNDLTENFMDYSPLLCYSSFTAGQAARMQAVIDGARNSLPASKGCLPACTMPIAAAFSAAPNPVLAGQTVVFTNNSTGATAFLWKKNGAQFSTDASPSLLFDVVGSFSIGLSVANPDPNCGDAAQLSIKVECPIVANFTADKTEALPGETFFFKNSTTGTATAFAWSVNGATVATTADLGHLFASPGFYTVLLKAVGPYCTDEHTLTIHIIDPDAPCEPTFFYRYGVKDAPDRGECILPKTGGGYYLGGSTGSPEKATIFGCDALGTMDWWSTTFDIPGDSRIWQIAKLADSKLLLSILTGIGTDTQSTVLANIDPTIAPTIWWSVKFTTAFLTRGGLLPLADGDFVAVANEQPLGGHFTITKFGPDGIVAWQKAYGLGTAVAIIHEIKEAANGDLIIAGATNFNTQSGLDCFYARLDAAGEVVWARQLGTALNEAFHNCDVLPDGNLLFSGLARQPSKNFGLAVKTDGLGNLLWQTSFAPYDNINALVVDQAVMPDGYVFGVQDRSTFQNDKRVFFKKISPDGTSTALLEKEFKGDPGQSIHLRRLEALPNGSFAIMGAIEETTDPLATDFFLMKTDLFGNLSGDCPGGDGGATLADPGLLPSSPSLIAMPPTEVKPMVIDKSIKVFEKTTICAPACQETCGNGKDDDLDGMTDCLDPDCPCSRCDGLQAGLWLMGNGAGLDFREEPPVPISGGQTFTAEASAVASDANGRLLFYADPTTVFNRKHQPMPNGTGIAGHPSSSQQLILPVPYRLGDFFLFTPDSYDNGPTSGLTYSWISMPLDSSFGNVVNGQKNIEMMPPGEATEQVAAVKICGSQEFWLASHRRSDDAYLLWKISYYFPPAPLLVQNIGASAAAPNGNFDVIGQMKFSPDGRRLARALAHTHAVEVLDFDPKTGLLSNPKLFPLGDRLAYGLEFSRSGRFLYASCLRQPATIEQIDLETGAVTLLASSPDEYRFGQLQLAVNGKIYFGNSGPLVFTGSLGVIHEPEMAGAGCLLEENAQPLGSPGGSVNLGLPGFASTFLREKVGGGQTYFNSIICRKLPATLGFKLKKPPCGVDSVGWKVTFNPFPGNPPTGIFTQKGLDTATLVCPKPGVYQVFATTRTACAVRRDTFRVWLLETPVDSLDLGPDLVLCENSTRTLAAPPGFEKYLWQDGSDGREFTAAGPGKFWVEATDHCGNRQTDTLVIALDPAAALDLPDSLTICPGDSIQLPLHLLFEEYAWSPADSLDCADCASPIFFGKKSTTLTVTARNGDCFATDSVRIEVLPGPSVAPFLTDKLTCEKDSVQLNSVAGTTAGEVFSWSGPGGFSSGGAAPVVFAAGQYFLTATTTASGCTATGLVEISEAQALPEAVFEADPVRCFGETNGAIRAVGALAGQPPFTYSIDNQPFTTDTIFENLPVGSYFLKIKDANGCLSEKEIEVSGPPFFDVGLAGDTLVFAGQEAHLVATVAPPGFVPSLVYWSNSDIIGPPEDSGLETAVPVFENTLFFIKIWDENGCPDSAYWPVRVDDERRVFVPNSIRPGPGENGLFTLFADGSVREVGSLRVFDRWGELLFEKKNFQPNEPAANGWDGRFRGGFLPPQVLAWVAEVVFWDGKTRVLRGSLTVVR